MILNKGLQSRHFHVPIGCIDSCYGERRCGAASPGTPGSDLKCGQTGMSVLYLSYLSSGLGQRQKKTICSTLWGEQAVWGLVPGDRQLGVLRGARKAAVPASSADCGRYRCFCLMHALFHRRRQWRSRSLRSAACTCRAPACGVLSFVLHLSVRVLVFCLSRQHRNGESYQQPFDLSVSGPVQTVHWLFARHGPLSPPSFFWISLWLSPL